MSDILLERLKEILRETYEGGPERVEGAGLGTIAHLAYHLGAIRQLMHRV